MDPLKQGMRHLNRKIWLVVALTIVIVAQLTILSEFYSISKEGSAANVSIVDISKESYMFARLTISITSDNNGASIVFPNGTQVNVNEYQTFSFTFDMTRTGDILGNAGAATDGISVSQSQPIDATVLSNYTSSQSSIDTSPLKNIPNIDVYLLIVKGFAEVTINGYGLAI
jgi:hypothetical protein